MRRTAQAGFLYGQITMRIRLQQVHMREPDACM